MFDTLMTGLAEVDAFLDGETAGYQVTLPKEVDVKAIRKQLNMTQASFSNTFGFSLDAVKHWEGGRRTPESSARAFLTVIARNPRAVILALHPGDRPGRAKRPPTESRSKRVTGSAKRATGSAKRATGSAKRATGSAKRATATRTTATRSMA